MRDDDDDDGDRNPHNHNSNNNSCISVQPHFFCLSPVVSLAAAAARSETHTNRPQLHRCLTLQAKPNNFARSLAHSCKRGKALPVCFPMLVHNTRLGLACALLPPDQLASFILHLLVSRAFSLPNALTKSQSHSPLPPHQCCQLAQACAFAMSTAASPQSPCNVTASLRRRDATPSPVAILMATSARPVTNLNLPILPDINHTLSICLCTSHTSLQCSKKSRQMHSLSLACSMFSCIFVGHKETSWRAAFSWAGIKLATNIVVVSTPTSQPMTAA